MGHVVCVGEEFVLSRKKEVHALLPPPSPSLLGGASSALRSMSALRLLELAVDLRITSVVNLCSEKLSEGTAHDSLSLLSGEWVAAAGVEALRAALAAVKLCAI